MADRKTLLSRFWPASGPRRTSATQTTAPSPATTNSPPKTEAHTPVSRSTTKARNTVSPTTQPSTSQIDDQPKSTSPEPRKSPPIQMQTTSQPIATTSSNPTDDPKTTSPSRGTTRSLSSSKPASPNARVAQSRSPPQPSSTSKKTSQHRLNSRSPKPSSSSPTKRMQPTSPPKESTKPNQEITSSHDAHILASNEEVPKLVTSQQEHQTKADDKSDTDYNPNGQTLNQTSFNRNEEELTPSQSSEVGKEKPAPSKSLESPTINDEHEPLVGLNASSAATNDFNRQTLNPTSFKHNAVELNPSQSSEVGSEKHVLDKSSDSSTTKAEREPSVGLKAKLKETKDVKEVMQTTSTEANEETKKGVDDSLPPNSGSKAQIIRQAELPGTPNQLHTANQEALHTKEILPTSVTQRNRRSTISGTHSKSDVPNGEHVPPHKNIKDNILTLVDKMAVGNPKGTIHDRPVSVITLAGENRGASMQMESSSSKKEGLIHIHRGYKTEPDESVEATTDGDGSSKRKKSEDANFNADQPTEAYVNNNAQGINNSIVFNSSVSEGNPGVHMIVTHVPKETIQSTNKADPAVTQKAEFNVTHMENLTYQPTVRRRCLRGLLLETSDSDPDKPRSHGCRVGCQKRDEENNIYDL